MPKQMLWKFDLPIHDDDIKVGFQSNGLMLELSFV